MTTRVYEAWKGSNKFIFGGRLIFGPDAWTLPVTLLLIIVPVILFCVSVSRHLHHKFSHYNAGYAITIVAILFTIYVLILLFLTSARDPGIVPRNSHPPEEKQRYETTISADGRRTWSLQTPRTKDVVVNGISVTVKYCYTCMLYRPPRCSHCSVCNNCIERFDHHCPFVGQCIGLRNYRCFIMFISSATLLCIYVFSMSALYMKILMDEKRGTVWMAMRESPWSVVLMIYSFIAMCFVGGLTGFHLYLITTNKTTYENTRYKEKDYNRGCVNNFLEVFCSKVEPSRNNFRAFIDEEPARFVEDEYEIMRQKVEHDLDIGEDLKKLSERCNSEEAKNYRPHHALDIDHWSYRSAYRAPNIRTETRHGKWGRTGSWEMF